jgi:hypothetical protein
MPDSFIADSPTDSFVPDSPPKPLDARNPQLPTIPLSSRAVPFRLRPGHDDTAVDRALEYTSGYEYDPGGMIVRGAQGVSSGLHKAGLDTLAVPGERTRALGRLRTPEGRQQVAGGIHEAIGGAMEAGTPLLPFAAAAAPAATVLGLGTGMAAQEGTTRGAKALGVPDAYADVMGDVAGLAAGTAGGHVGSAIDTRLPMRPPSPPRPAPGVPPRAEPPVTQPPPTDGTSYHIPDPQPPAFPVPTGIDAAIRAREQLGPMADTVPRRLLGTTPYQEHLLDTLGPAQASMLPRRLAAAQPDVSPGGRPGQPAFEPPRPPAPPSIDKMVNPTTGEVTYWDINKPGQGVALDDPRVAAYERANPPSSVPARRPSQAPPEIAEERPAPGIPAQEEAPPPTPEPPPPQTVTTAPETPAPEAAAPEPPTPTGPLAEPAYEAPKPPTPTPLEEPKPVPVMQEPQAPAAAPIEAAPPPPEPAPAPESVPSQLPARRARYAQRGAATPDFLNPSWLAEGVRKTPGAIKAGAKGAADAYDAAVARVAKTPPGRFIRGIAQAVAPTSVVNRAARDEFFNAKGEREWQNTLYDRAMKGMHGTLESLPKSDQVAFIDRMQKGEEQPDANLSAIADFVKETTDSLFKSASKYSNILDYLDNYGVHMAWKKPPLHPDFDVNGRPVSTPQGGTMEGNKAFIKQRFWKTLSAGMEHGGEPMSTNALDLLGLQVDSVSRFVSANRFWDGLKRLDQAHWVPDGQPVPEGYVRWNDPLANQGKGTGAIGQEAPKGQSGKGFWVVDQGAAKLLQNYLSRDALRDIRGTAPGSPERSIANIGRSIMALKNFHTSWELGFSGFHALFEAAEVQASVMGLGVRKLFNSWDPKAAMKDLGESIVPGLPMTRTFNLGRAARKFVDLNARDLRLDQIKNTEDLAKNPIYEKMFKQYPDALNLMKDYFSGGGTFTLSKDLQQGMLGKIKKAMNEDPSVQKYLKVTGLGAVGLPEMMAYPLFHVYIPNLKMGLFMREYAQALREQSPRIEKGLTTREAVAQRTLAFVEDRLGEMNFDNLVWNKTFKTMLQMGFRSVTWKLGTLRAIAKTPLTQAREFKHAAQEGRAPQIAPEAAWAAGMLGTMALFGGATHWALSGKPPKGMRDVMFPQYDPDDETARFVYPSYAKEMKHIQHDPTGYITSGAAGMWSKYGEAARNRDHYNTEIRDPNASVPTQVGQTLEHMFPLPISVSSLQRSKREGGNIKEQIGAFAGLPRAPRYAFEDAGTQKLRELLGKRTGETKTASEFQRRQYMKGLERAYVAGRTAQAKQLAQKGLNEGMITEDDAVNALELGDKNANPDDRFVNSARKLDIDNSLELWPDLNNHQRELLQPFVVKKFVDAAETKPRAILEDLLKHAKRAGFEF